MRPIYRSLTAQEVAVPLNNELALTVKVERRTKRLSLKDMARELNTTIEDYRACETGKKMPTVEQCRGLARVLYEGDTKKIADLYRIGQQQRNEHLFLLLLTKNRVTLENLKEYVEDNETYMSIIKSALIRRVPNLDNKERATVRKEIATSRVFPVYQETVTNIANALLLDQVDLCRKILIETVIRKYVSQRKKHSELFAVGKLRSILTQAITVLTNQRHQVIEDKDFVVKEPEADRFFTRTFSSFLRFEGVGIEEASQRDTIDKYMLTLYYKGVRLPASTMRIVQKVCSAFDIGAYQAMREVVIIEDMARKQMIRTFHGSKVTVPAEKQKALDGAVQVIVDEYSELGRALYEKRCQRRLSMRNLAGRLGLVFDEYLELEWSAYPSTITFNPSVTYKLIDFLQIDDAELQRLLSVETEQRDELARKERISQIKPLSSSAAQSASLFFSDQKWAKENTAAEVAKTLSAKLHKAKLTVHVLRRYQKTFISHFKNSDVCFADIAERAGFDTFKLRTFYNGRVFPNNHDLRKMCKGFEVEYSPRLQRIVEIEKLVQEYQMEVARLGPLPLDSKMTEALDRAAALKLKDYSEFSQRLFKRRAQLRLSQLDAAQRLGLKQLSDYRKLELSLNPSLSRTLRQEDVRARIAEFLGITVSELVELVNAGDQRVWTSRARRDTPESVVISINKRIRDDNITVDDILGFGKTFSSCVAESLIGVPEAATKSGLEVNRLRQYVDGKGLPKDNQTLRQVCVGFDLHNYPSMQRLVEVERLVRRYMMETSRIGALPLDEEFSQAFEMASHVVMSLYSEFSRRLFTRRSELKMTQTDAATRLGLPDTNSYRKMEFSISPVIDRGLKKDQRVLQNLAEFLQISVAELRQMFVERRPQTKQSDTYTAKLAADGINDKLDKLGITLEMLREFDQSFSSRLRKSGVSLQDACQRSVFGRAKIKPCLEGQHLPADRSELSQFCKDFSLSKPDEIPRIVEIERIVRDYMSKTIRYGELPLANDIRDALNLAVEIIMSDYTELSRRLVRRRLELRLPIERVSEVIGISTNDYYRKLERCISIFNSKSLFGNQQVIASVAKFLQMSIPDLEDLVDNEAQKNQQPVPISISNELKTASKEVIKQLGRKGVTPLCLRNYSKTFATHLKEATVTPSEVIELIPDLSVEQLEMYLCGEQLPNDNNEVKKLCAAFAIDDYERMQKVVDIEYVVRGYMDKIAELGPIPFPEETKDALNRIVGIIKSGYSEFSKLLSQKRFNLKMTMEEAAQRLGIDRSDIYNELERSALPARVELLQKDPRIIENLSSFLEMPVDDVKKLIHIS